MTQEEINRAVRQRFRLSHQYCVVYAQISLITFALAAARITHPIIPPGMRFISHPATGMPVLVGFLPPRRTGR